jgi:hypothetical protein
MMTSPGNGYMVKTIHGEICDTPLYITTSTLFTFGHNFFAVVLLESKITREYGNNAATKRNLLAVFFDTNYIDDLGDEIYGIIRDQDLRSNHI